MRYIVVDLEWNNAFSPKSKKAINEIIEIGAVKLDENLAIKDTISTFIRPSVGKKLSKRVVEMTNITDADVASGMSFINAVKLLKSWIAPDDIVMTWGDTDIRVLVENCKEFSLGETIPFLGRYLDLQKYCQSKMDGSFTTQQLGLAAAADLLGIKDDKFSHHRALDDSLLSVECLKKVFDENSLKKMAKDCDEVFYRKLNFRTHYILDINSPAIEPSALVCICDVCGKQAKQLDDWKISCQAFQGIFKCQNCGRKFRKTVRFKQYFDHVAVSEKTYVIIKAKTENKNTKSRVNAAP